MGVVGGRRPRADAPAPFSVTIRAAHPLRGMLRSKRPPLHFRRTGTRLATQGCVSYPRNATLDGSSATFSANFTEFTLHFQHASLAYAPRQPITTVEKTRTKRTEETDEALHWRSRCVSVRPKRWGPTAQMDCIARSPRGNSDGDGGGGSGREGRPFRPRNRQGQGQGLRYSIQLRSLLRKIVAKNVLVKLTVRKNAKVLKE